MVSKENIFVAGLIIAVLVAGFALGEPSAPQSLTEISDTTFDASNWGPQSITALAGNITALNIAGLSQTKAWQGYYGNVTGFITLDDALNNTFYNWSVASVQGEVYATRVTSVTWSDVNCTNASNVTSEETYLGQAATDGDSVSNTFAGTTHPAFSAGTSNILVNTCPSTNGYVNNATQSTNWSMVMLYDHTGQAIIYTSLINDTTVGFDGGTYDFQLLVGENQKTGNLAATNYYFWVELV